MCIAPSGAKLYVWYVGNNLLLIYFQAYNCLYLINFTSNTPNPNLTNAHSPTSLLPIPSSICRCHRRPYTLNRRRPPPKPSLPRPPTTTPRPSRPIIPTTSHQPPRLPTSPPLPNKRHHTLPPRPKRHPPRIPPTNLDRFPPAEVFAGTSSGDEA